MKLCSNEIVFQFILLFSTTGVSIPMQNPRL